MNKCVYILKYLLVLLLLFFFSFFFFAEEKGSEKMAFVYYASYMNLICDSNEQAKIIADIILKKITVQTALIECILNDTCTLDQAHITNCTNRTKRETRNKTAGFKLTVGCISGLCK